MHNITDSSIVCSQGEKEQKNGTEDSYQMKRDWKTMTVRVVNSNKQVFKGCRVCNFH